MIFGEVNNHEPPQCIIFSTLLSLPSSLVEIFPSAPCSHIPYACILFSYDDKSVTSTNNRQSSSFIIKEMHKKLLFQNEKEKQDVPMVRQYYNVPLRNRVVEVGKFIWLRIGTT
jgi:hypothetical protein